MQVNQVITNQTTVPNNESGNVNVMNHDDNNNANTNDENTSNDIDDRHGAPPRKRPRLASQPSSNSSVNDDDSH